MTDRGEWRGIYQALLNGPSFNALSKWARALWYPVKLRLGPLGIAPVPGAVGVFAEMTALDYQEVQRARDELIENKWVRIDGNVWWMVRGLEFEPILDPNNANHRIFVQREWQKLPNLLIRAEFAAAYPSWFGGMSKAIDGMSKAIKMGSGTLSEGMGDDISITKTKTKTKTQTKTTDYNNDDDSARAREAVLVPFNLVDRAYVEMWLGGLSATEQTTWIGRLGNYLQGLDFPGGKKATPAAIATAIRDLAPGEEINPAKFRRFVERAMSDAANPVGTRLPQADVHAAAMRNLEAKYAR